MVRLVGSDAILLHRVLILNYNDETSKRAYESSTDAYRVFKKMLKSGHPPDDWSALLEEAKGETNRLEKIVKAEI